MNYVGNEPAPAGLVLVGDTNPIGLIGWFHAPPNGSWLRLNGQAALKATYPDLWAYAQGFLTADQVVNPGLYKSIDANTFSLPNLDGLFIRSQGGISAALGAKQRHDVGAPSSNPAAPWMWGRQVAASGVTLTSSGGANTDSLIGFGSETRPDNVAFVPCVKALKSALIPATSLPLRTKAFTRQVFLAGAGNYITPAGCLAINVRLVGGGGSGATSGPNGGDTTFGPMTASGGHGAFPVANFGGNGGLAAGGDINIAGNSGPAGISNTAATVALPGLPGGGGPWGGTGVAGYTGVAGGPSAANSGAGGSSDGVAGAQSGRPAGGSGGYVEKLFTAPAPNYAYSVGAGGVAGIGGQAGGSGIIIVDEYY